MKVVSDDTMSAAEATTTRELLSCSEQNSKGGGDGAMEGEGGEDLENQEEEEEDDEDEGDLEEAVDEENRGAKKAATATEDDDDDDEEAALLVTSNKSGSHHTRVPEVGYPLNNNSKKDGPPVFSSAYNHPVSGNLTTNAVDLEVFHCPECPYETYNVAALTSHQKIHKMYQCDVCQMKFSHAANMRRHRMRHTGFKPFECRVCLKRFFRKDHLMEHMITHSKQLPFQCPMCDKSFNRQVYFKAHLQANHWNLPSDKICGICGHKAATIKGAKLHYTTRHAKAANTVNSSSPANSRALAEGSLLGPVTSASLVSARLEHSPTLLARPELNPTASPPPLSSSRSSLDASSLTAGLNLSTSAADKLCSSQIMFSQLSTSSASLANFMAPLTMNSRTTLSDIMNMGGVTSPPVRFEVQDTDKPPLCHMGSLSPSIGCQGDHQRPLENGLQQQQPESIVIKCEPPEEILLDDGRSQSNTTSDDEEDKHFIDASGHPHHHHHHYLRHHHHHPNHHRQRFAPTAAAMASPKNQSDSCSPSSTLLDLAKTGSAAGSIGTTSDINDKGICSTSLSSPSTAVAVLASAGGLNRQVSVGDVTITPLVLSGSGGGGAGSGLYSLGVGGGLVCVHCGIVFPDQTLYFLHKGVHSESNPWKCNICGELCRDKYDFNTHVLSKAHQ